MKMHTQRDNKRKVSLRTLALSEVTQLRDAQPSKANLEQWTETNARYDRKLSVRDRWMGGVNRAELDSLVNDGWADGAARIAAMVEQFRDKLPAPTSIRRRKVWSDQGDEMDRDRLYNGQVESAWRRTQRMEVGAPQIVSLVLPWCHSESTTHEQMFWGAAAVLACTDLLEGAGYQVELLACNPIIAGAGWLSATLVTLKEAGEPLRMDALAAMTAHAGTYRYYGIPSVAHVPTKVGIGWAVSMISIGAAVAKLVDAGFMTQPFDVSERAYSRDAAVRYIAGIVARLEAPAHA